MNTRPLNTSDVAERLGVDVRTVQRWIAAGRFPGAYRVDPQGSRSPYLIPENDVVAFEERRKQTVTK
jgi:excisionase family DNA binding protein